MPSATAGEEFISSPAVLLNRGLNEIAYHYTKKIIPHKEKIKSEIMRGGDSIAVKLIENSAFNLAINRLDKIVSSEDDPEADDLYNLGLIYEALNEFHIALEYYLKAGNLEPEEKIIAIALRRLRRIVP